MAPIVSWSEVVAVGAQLAAVDPLLQNAILLYVNNDFNVEVWGGEDSETLYLGRLFLAAHLGSVPRSGISGTTGAVTSETIGPISRSFAMSSSSGQLSTTPYGAEYQALLDTLGLGVVLI